MKFPRKRVNSNSSLGYLAKLPVNTLKIDRSFIITMDKAPDSMTIVSTIISLAHAFKLNVVAEGVDSENQMRLLKLLKCDEIQGYLISKPLPAADLVRFLREKAAPAWKMHNPTTQLEIMVVIEASSRACGLRLRPLVMLRKFVLDVVPRRLRAHKSVYVRLDLWIIIEHAQWNSVS